MPFDYTVIKGRADALIARFGTDATLTRINASYSPTTGNATGSATNYTGKGVTFSRQVVDRNDSTIRKTEQVAYLSMSVEPTPGDELTIGGVKYRVTESRPLRPATVTVLNEVIIVGL